MDRPRASPAGCGPCRASSRPRPALPHARRRALALALGRLSLLARAARRLERLTPEQAAGVRAAIGYPVTTEEMAARPGLVDEWAVLAHAVEDEDKLTARTVWLAGRTSGAMAQVVDYGTSGSPLPPVPAAGQDFSGSLAFHPGDPPLRAAFREGRASPAPAGALPGATSVAEALDGFAGALARAPWIDRWPLRLSGLRLGHLADGAMGAGDATGCLTLADSAHVPPLMAVAAGGHVDLFGLYDGFGAHAPRHGGRRASLRGSGPGSPADPGEGGLMGLDVSAPRRLGVGPRLRSAGGRPLPLPCRSRDGRRCAAARRAGHDPAGAGCGRGHPPSRRQRLSARSLHAGRPLTRRRAVPAHPKRRRGSGCSSPRAWRRGAA